jgi:hypothetical protein
MKVQFEVYLLLGSDLCLTILSLRSVLLGLGRLGFHSMLLADKLSHEGLSDVNSLLAEIFEYVEVSGGWLKLKIKPSYLSLVNYHILRRLV